jgi:uncharacterized protein (UPF0335 family)
MSPGFAWRQPDGALVSCREKLRLLEENQAELARMMQDAFEDAVLMGVDPAQMKSVLAGIVDRLVLPKK